jgi:hypothetical protein
VKLTVGKFKSNVQSGVYNKKQLVNMLKHFLDMKEECNLSFSEQNTQKLNVLKHALGVENMTREEMILKGLIKPAQSPVEEFNIPVSKCITDSDVAKKFLQLQESAKRRDKEFNISLSDVRTLLKKKSCHYTGMSFSDVGNFKRTIDRVDNTKGYVKGNVVACSHIANQLKEMLVENKDSPFKGNTKALKKFIDKL